MRLRASSLHSLACIIVLHLSDKTVDPHFNITVAQYDLIQLGFRG